uniref:Atlastin 2 n=1 Tax=Rhipicephalus appendiculatus TaxID=34631 RepID=A0A131Z0A6_RHIAP
MSDRVDSGQPLSILNVDGRSLELDEHGLARLLLDERFKDKHVVVIAVAGAFRKGKSFLLCFLLCYLRSGGRAEWIGDPNVPLEGFEWRGGSRRHTSGILMWNEVFLVKPSQGEELAVLLVDTQGTFDCESATLVHASIFSLSAMISSVLVYNVSQNIQQNDLQHLQDFLDYGMLTQSAQHQQPSSTTAEVGCTRPFQSLMFLVRDWQFERPYGLEGGRPLLEQRLKGPQNQDRELRQLRRKLSRCFKEMRCFLMPHPGLTVAREGFDGRLSDMDETFKLHLFEFVRLLLNPDNLLPKEINGRKVTCQELFSYIKVYVDAHKKGLLEDPSQMLQAAYHGSCRAAMDKSLDFYTTSMLSLWQNSPDDDVDRETMRRYHNDLRRVAVEKYSAAPKMGGELPAELYLHKLLEKIDATFDVYCNYLKEKKKTFINSAVFKHVAFKVAHGFLTTGLAAAAIALAVVELPIVAIALGAFGAASLSGHLIQAIVEMELAKRKKKERFENSKAAAEAAKSRGIGADDIEECDDETPLVSHEQLPAQDDTCSVLSLELAESASTSPEAPVTVTDEGGTAQANHSSTATEASNGRDCSDDRTPLLNASDDTDSLQSADFPDFERVSLGPPVTVCDHTAVTEAANSAAFDRAIKHYSDGMQQVCGDSIPRLSEEELRRYHDLLQVYARNILIRGCSSTSNRELPHFLDRLTSETEEQFKYFVNQNREKPPMRT